MRAALSAMFTGSKTRRMHPHVTSKIHEITKTLREQILSGRDNIFEAKELAKTITLDVSRKQ